MYIYSTYGKKVNRKRYIYFTMELWNQLHNDNPKNVSKNDMCLAYCKERASASVIEPVHVCAFSRVSTHTSFM